MRKAQFRANSGEPAAGENDAAGTVIEAAGVAGSAQAKSLGGRNEAGFGLPDGDAAGARCESVAGVAAQQGMT